MYMPETTEPPAAHGPCRGERVVEVREAQVKDDADLARMGRSFFESTPLPRLVEFDSESLIRFVHGSFDSENVAVFVAELDGAVIGAVAGIVFPLYLNDSVSIGQELFWWVDEPARKSNAGNLLHKTLHEWAKGQGASILTMCSIANGTSERIDKLYIHAGFIPTEHFFMRSL